MGVISLVWGGGGVGGIDEVVVVAVVVEVVVVVGAFVFDLLTPATLLSKNH